MERHAHRPTSPAISRRARLWLAANRGIRLARPPMVAPADAPELKMHVRFEGLTDAEQRAALAAFPGGRRFVLDA